MSDDTETTSAPAGIVKTAGVDDVLERVELALDAQAFKTEFYEGRELTTDEIERKRALLAHIVRECNLRLAGRVRIVGGWPELRGFGARLQGFDSDHREYTIEFYADDEQRMYHQPDDAEQDVRETVGMIVSEILAQRERYLTRGGLA